MSNRTWRASAMSAAIALLVVTGCATANTTASSSNNAVATTNAAGNNTATGNTASNSTANNAGGIDSSLTNQTSNSATSPSTSTSNLPGTAVVATYNGGQVTKAELDKQYNMMLIISGGQSAPPTKSQFATDYVVLYRYFYDQAVKNVKKGTVTKPPASIGSQIVQQLASQNGVPATQVTQQMKSLGITNQDFADYYYKEEYMNAYMQTLLKGTKVTTAQAQAYYNQHKTDYMTVTVSHILVKTDALAKKIEAQLKAGANFAKLADKYSIDPGVKQNHGTYANATVSQFVPPFAKACETLPIGQISDPVHSQFGYHVMRVDKRTQQTFKQVESTIQQTLVQTAQQTKEQSILKAAQKAAKVKIVVKASDL